MSNKRTGYGWGHGRENKIRKEQGSLEKYQSSIKVNYVGVEI